MKRVFFTVMCVAALFVLASGSTFGQKKPQCEQANLGDQNWTQINQEYYFFDYVLCPANMNPPNPIVRVWLTASGDGVAIERWATDHEEADVVSLFRGKKKALSIYRNLAAVPLTVFKAESRSRVPTDLTGQPFVVQGSSLVPFSNLVPESAERTRKIIENADVLIRTAQKKSALHAESPRIGEMFSLLQKDLKSLN